MNPAEREARETCSELIRTLENVHTCYHVAWTINENIESAQDKFAFAQSEAKRIVTEIEGEADNVRPFLENFNNFRNREVAHVQPNMRKKYPLHGDLETCAACCASIADNF